MISQAIETGLIEPETLQALLKGGSLTHLKILDSSLPMPGSDQDVRAAYEARHIPGGRFFDINTVSDHKSPLPHMLPSPDVFESAMANLGIAHSDTVIVYGQTGVIMGPARAWWTFRVFDHDKVCVLNGGLPAWLAAGCAIESGAPPAPITAARFKAAYRPELVAAPETLLESGLILDARPESRFQGAAPEPRPGLRSGHIPGSRNIPASTLVDADGRLKSPDEIREIMENKGFTATTPVTATCGSGVTACVIALALYRIGSPGTAVYDGSWAEWGREGSPMPVSIGE